MSIWPFGLFFFSYIILFSSSCSCLVIWKLCWLFCFKHPSPIDSSLDLEQLLATDSRHQQRLMICNHQLQHGVCTLWFHYWYWCRGIEFTGYHEGSWGNRIVLMLKTVLLFWLLGINFNVHYRIAGQPSSMALACSTVRHPICLCTQVTILCCEACVCVYVCVCAMNKEQTQTGNRCII